jgi:hypothetical protein
MSSLHSYLEERLRNERFNKPHLGGAQNSQSSYPTESAVENPPVCS